MKLLPSSSNMELRVGYNWKTLKKKKKKKKKKKNVRRFFAKKGIKFNAQEAQGKHTRVANINKKRGN